MKANKYTIIVCVLIGIITCVAMIGIKDSNSKLFVVTVGIFTGVIVSLVSTVVIYFDKRATIYQAVKSNIADIYITSKLNIFIICKIKKEINFGFINFACLFISYGRTFRTKGNERHKKPKNR